MVARREQAFERHAGPHPGVECARADRQLVGDVCLSGRDGPLSSLRLENFCDGIEDYDLLATTEALLGRSGADAAVADKLRDALYLEDEFIRDAVSYSTDPALLADRRRVLIGALAAAAKSRVMR